MEIDARARINAVLHCVSDDRRYVCDIATFCCGLVAEIDAACVLEVLIEVVLDRGAVDVWAIIDECIDVPY